VRRFLGALIAVAAIAALAGAASRVDGLRNVVLVAVPCGALAVFLAGLSWRVIRWSLSPVPFRIPTVCGQQKSLAWIKSSKLESPHSFLGAAGRMALEVLLFRSLFRGTRSRIESGPRLICRETRWLWAGALAFHWSLLVILLRHLRFFIEPAPGIATLLAGLDGFLEIGAPALYLTDVALAVSLLYLLARRLTDGQVRYISLFTDYFALFLLLGIALSGVSMRYLIRVDAVVIKQFALSLAIFAPAAPKDAGMTFFIHLTLVSALAAYFPFSKLVHMAGVFLSPTRNLANNNRMKRHVNPWNCPVKVHTYQEWEEEFHDKIRAAGLPLERP
jgi:nitrate reductase gamma subunit